MNCGSPTKETFAKFCPSCGKSFLETSNASSNRIKTNQNIPKKNAIIEEIEENEDSAEKVNDLEINKEDFGAEAIEVEGIQKQTFRSLETAKKTGFSREIPESNIKRKGKKDKNFREKVWQDFAKEAGTLRGGNKKSR